MNEEWYLLEWTVVEIENDWNNSKKQKLTKENKELLLHCAICRSDA